MYRKSKTYNYACARLYIHIHMYVCMYKLRNVYLVMRLLSSFLLHLLIINYIILLLSSKSVVSNNERKRGRDSVNSLSGSVRKCQIKKKKEREWKRSMMRFAATSKTYLIERGVKEIKRRNAFILSSRKTQP